MGKTKPRTAIAKFIEALPEKMEENLELSFGKSINPHKQQHGESLIYQLPSGKKVRFVIKSVNPKKCRIWKGNIRLQDFLNDETTKDLREKVEAQGQLVPVLARPLKEGSDYTHEIIYGSRRHFVCSTLGMELKLLEAEIDDNDALLFMDAENSGRATPSAYETAVAYKYWLEKKIFENQSELAKKMGISRTWVNQIISLSKIPKEIISVFTNPKDFSLKMGLEISKILSNNNEMCDKMLERVGEIGRLQLSPQDIFNELVKVTQLPSPISRPAKKIILDKTIYSSSGDKICKISTSKKGSITVTFNSKFPSSKLDGLLEKFEKLAKEY